jgi:hypothetical protein
MSIREKNGEKRIDYGNCQLTKVNQHDSHLPLPSASFFFEWSARLEIINKH